jgi:repressor of nif and glnA expression
LKNLGKSLTRPNYTQLLRILGKVDHPLSSYQIKKEMEKAGMKESESPYVYDMLRQLTPDVDQRLESSFN